MASMAKLLILLSMSIAFSALAIPEKLPDLFPIGTSKGTHIHAVLERIKGACPPFGNSDERFGVKVLGTTSPEIGGCASMVTPNHHIVPSFNLWLGSPKFGGGGGCGEQNMDHYLFECMAKHPFFTEKDTLEGWYVMLFDRTARWTGRQDYRCALYKTVNEEPPTIQMMISANQSCKGLSERMKQSEYTVPEGSRHFTDGSVALHFTKDLQQTAVWRKKRSEVQSGGCRFPDWSQGSWRDLKVDGSLALYDSAFHEKDDVDYGQEGDDGKDGDAETTGGEQYIQRSQRQKRCFGEQTTTTERHRDMDFENAAKRGYEGIDFPTTRNPTFPFRRTRSVDEDLDEKYKNTEHNNEIALKIIQINELFHWFNKMQALNKLTNHSAEHAKGNTADLKKIPNDIHLMTDQIQKIKDLGKQTLHEEENTNENDGFKLNKKYKEDDVVYGQESDDGKDGDAETTGGEQYIQRSQRQKRCFGEQTTTTERHRDMNFENAAKRGYEGIDFPTTRNPTFPFRRTRSVDKDLDEKYKSNDEKDGKDEDAETTGGEQYIQRSQRQKRCFFDQPTTTERHRDLDFENAAKRGYADIDFPTTRNPSFPHRKTRSVDEDLDEKYKSNDGKDGKDEDAETTGGKQYIQRSQRQKRCFGEQTTTTERHRDMDFENAAKRGYADIDFPTTRNPTFPFRRTRSVDEDLDEKYKNTEHNNEIALKIIQINELFHWFNKMQALNKLTNHSGEHAKGNTADLKKIPNDIHLMTDQIQKIKDLGKQTLHEEENTNENDGFKLNKKYKEDDVVYGQESDDGKDGDAETTGGEQYIQRSQRQKRCFGEQTTTTERHRDMNFENAAKRGYEGIDFPTTRNPTFPFRRTRSVDKDLDEKYKSNDEKDEDAETTGGEQYIQRSQRQKRCFGEQTTTTERHRDMDFENAAKRGYADIDFPTTRNPSFPFRRTRSVDEDLDEKYKNTEHNNEIALKIIQINELFNWFNKMQALKKLTNHSGEHAKGNTADLKKISNDVHLMSDKIKKIKDLGKQTIHKEEDTNENDDFKFNKKYKEGDGQLSTRNKNPRIENLLKKWYQKESSSKTNKFLTTYASPDRKRRSIDEDLDSKSKNTEDDEEEALNKIKALDQFNRYMRWLNIVNAMVSIKHHRLEQSNKEIKVNEIFPEDTPVPSPVKYLKFAEMKGIPYKQALINWRSMERAHRQKEAKVVFSAYPGQNHPDIVMKDFDQTFDGIEYDFDPMYPEGTADDPIAYRALTLPSGYQIKPQQSRRTTYEQKQSRDAPESATMVSHFQAIHSNSLDDRTYQGNTPSLKQRMRRSSTQQNQQQSATTFSWSCEMQVDNDERHNHQFEKGAKFLTYGGRIVENNILPGNDQHNENDSEKTYGCLWLVPRGPNILEFSIIGTGMPLKNQSMQNFARQLCSENRANGKDSGIRNEKKLRPRRPWWITETRTDDKKLVPVGCPVPPGIEFYGVVPAPPPPSTVSTNKAQPTPLRLCARLVSSADDCTTGQMGPTDQMKYTVSECVEQHSSSTGTAQTVVAPQTIFEASREHIVGGSWQRNKRHSAPTDTSTVVSPVTSTSSNMPNLPFSSHNPLTGAINNITDHQTIRSTATVSIAMNPSSTGIQSFTDITTTAPTNFTTTTATTFSTATSSTLPLSSVHEPTSPERQLPSPSKSFNTATTPSTSTAAVPDNLSYHPTTDYHYRQHQQWQQPHPQPNTNDNDYYYQGRQQHYPPPTPGSTGMDNNNYYLHQQHWPQQQPQSYWLPQQHLITTRDYSNGNQHQTIDSGGRRTGDYYYRQQQQNYHNHQHNNDRQLQMPQPSRNSSFTLQHPTSNSWNIRGDRPLYISSGGGSDNNRDALVTWNSSSSINNGGWTTAAQQHWWYQQQQQRWQEEQQQQQQLQQQQQQQKRQQQNNRGLGGILSLPPIPLPPLHSEQGAITVSMPTPLPLHPRRPHKPSNQYYLPTLTTKTSPQSYQLRSKSESRYYQEREYQCLGQWTEPQQQISPVAGEKSVMLTYTYLKRLNPITKEGPQYECFVGTPIPNDEGLNPETTTTILLTEAGTNTKCSRLSDPYRSGMKLVGTKIMKQGACKGFSQPAQDTASGSWYSLKPQPISQSIPGTENGGGAWYAAPPVPVVAQGPTTMMPILTGRHTGGNGATFISRQNEQTRRPQSANPPPKTNNSNRTVADKRIFILLAVILFAREIHNIAPRFFN